MVSTSGIESARSGIAVISVVLVLAAVAVLATGASFVSFINLRVAQNAQTSAIAQNNAESGLDLSLIVLSAEYRRLAGAFPTLTALRQVVPEDGFIIEDVRLEGGNEAIVEVRGFGPNGAEHLTAARVRGVDGTSPTTGSLPPLLTIGFVSRGTVFMPGNGTFNLDMWAGGDVIATGGLSNFGEGFSGRAAGTECRVGQSTCRVAGDGLEPPVEPPPLVLFSFEDGRNQLIEEYREETGLDFPAMCTRFVSGTTSLSNLANEVVCLEPGASLTLSGNSNRNVRVIGDETTYVNFNGLAGVTSSTDVGVKVASGRLDIGTGPGSAGGPPGQAANCNRALCGLNTFYAQQAVVVDKAVTGGRVPNQRDAASTYIASEGDIRLNGGGNRAVTASFQTNGVFCFNGTLTRFTGTVYSAVDDSVPDTPEYRVCEWDDTRAGIRINGSVNEANLPSDFQNPNLPPPPPGVTSVPQGIVILARRL